MKNTIQELLSTAAQISKAHNTQQESIHDFNIFQALEIERREVYLCRVISKLITPTEHPHGAAFLKLFFDHVLVLPVTTEECKAAYVEREHLIHNDRRIDIFIRCGKFNIPIEAKIDAEDQKKQLLDYSKYCQNAPIYYLTLDGHAPSNASIEDDREDGGRLQSEHLCCISFSQHILSWLNACLPICENTPHLRSILLQLKEVLQENTNEERIHIAMDVANEILMQKSSGFKAAVAIEDGLRTAKTRIMTEFFEKLHSGLAAYHPLALDYDAINQYYNGKAKTWPGIMIPLRSPNEEWSFALRIEVDHRLYYGVCNYCKNTKYQNDHTCQDESQRERRQYVIDHLKPNIPTKDSKAFYWWSYLPASNGKVTDGNVLNFHTCRGKYYDLLDREAFDTVIAETVAPIKELLDKYN